jgi:adenylate cyclase
MGHNRSWWIALALAGLALAETLALRGLSPLEHRFQDALLRRHAATRVPDPQIVIAAIDERSLEAMARPCEAQAEHAVCGFGRYPWPRSVHGQLMEHLARAGAKAIVFDVAFTDPDADRPDDDHYLVETAVATPSAFFPLVRLEHADDRQGLALDEHGPALGFTRTASAPPGARAALLLPFRGIAETGRIGAINYLPDDDGVGRRYWLALEVQGWRIPSLPARVAAALGYAVPAQEAIELNWRGRPPERPRVSYSDLLADLSRETPEHYGAQVRDRIVVVGALASGLGDLRPTPIDGVHPGVDILATAIETLKNGDALRRPPPAVDAALALADILLVALLFLAGLGPVAVGAVLLALTPLSAWAAAGALARGWLVPVVTPLAFAWAAFIARSLREYLRELAARREAVRAFGRFVDPRVVQTLVASGGGDPRRSKGQSKVVTLLFSDIRGFTTLSESRSPEEVVEILNRYFSRQVDVIFRHGGTVDKFIGDAIMAFWGAPVDDPRHAQNAVRAALEMARVVDEFRRELPGALASEFDIGIGLNTGPAVVGFIGSENKLDYTAIGDTVNLASRIEGATKGVARILVSGATRAACGEEFMFTDRGTFKAKGKTEEVRLYEPAVRTPEAPRGADA